MSTRRSQGAALKPAPPQPEGLVGVFFAYGIERLKHRAVPRMKVVPKIHPEHEDPVLIKTLLNRCYWLKSFVYAKASMEMVKSVEAIVVQIEPRKNSRVCCSGCGRTASGYDHMSEARHFEFVRHVGDEGVFSLPHAAGQLPAVRGEGRRGALGQGQESSELANAMVSGPVGEALELGRDGKGARTGATSSSRSRRWCVGGSNGAI